MLLILAQAERCMLAWSHLLFLAATILRVNSSSLSDQSWPAGSLEILLRVHCHIHGAAVHFHAHPLVRTCSMAIKQCTSVSLLACAAACRLTLPAWQQLQQGQKNDWLPDDQLCELLIEVFCRSSKRLDRAMRFVRSDMPVRLPLRRLS